MHYLLVTVLTIVAFGTQSVTCDAAEDRGELASFLDSTISRLEAEKQAAHALDSHTFDAAIEALLRLRDRKSWPVVNSPIAITQLQNSSWELRPDDNGFRQRLHLGGVGSSWAQSERTKPMSFTWLTESNRIRLSYLSSFREAWSWEIVDKTYTYELKGDKLIMKAGDEIMEWHRQVDK